MKRDTITLVRNIYRANKARNKTDYLEVFLDDFEVLKLEIHLSSDLKQYLNSVLYKGINLIYCAGEENVT